VNSLLEFAKGGYKKAEEEKVSPPRGLIAELIHLYSVAAIRAYQGIKKGNVFTPDLMFIAAPLLFILVILFLIFAPNPAPPKRNYTPQTSESEGDVHQKDE